MIHSKINDLIYKKPHVCVTGFGGGDFTHNSKRVISRLKIPQGLSTLLFFAGGVKFPQGEGSAVIHHRRNDLIYKKPQVLVVVISPIIVNGS